MDFAKVSFSNRVNETYDSKSALVSRPFGKSDRRRIEKRPSPIDVTTSNVTSTGPAATLLPKTVLAERNELIGRTVGRATFLLSVNVDRIPNERDGRNAAIFIPIYGMGSPYLLSVRPGARYTPKCPRRCPTAASVAFFSKTKNVVRKHSEFSLAFITEFRPAFSKQLGRMFLKMSNRRRLS